MQSSCCCTASWETASALPQSLLKQAEVSADKHSFPGDVSYLQGVIKPSRLWEICLLSRSLKLLVKPSLSWAWSQQEQVLGMVISRHWVGFPSRCCVPPARNFTSPCSPADIPGGTQNPEPPSQNIRASHWLWEVSLSSNPRCPCAGQYKDTVCIATIRVSYLNSL